MTKDEQNVVSAAAFLIHSWWQVIKQVDEALERQDLLPQTREMFEDARRYAIDRLTKMPFPVSPHSAAAVKGALA